MCGEAMNLKTQSASRGTDRLVAIGWHRLFLVGALSVIGGAACSSSDTPRSSSEPMLTTRGGGPAVVVTAPLEPAPLPRTVETTREPWKFAAYPGYVITTPNYRIYTTIASERILRRLPLFLECAMTRYTTVLADLPTPEQPLQTYIFRDRRQWSAKTRQMLPEQAGAFENLGRGGFSTRGTSVLYYIDWAGRDKDTFAIAAHEGWHQYTQQTFRHPLPVWLEEGIATYMEGYRFRLSYEVPEFSPSRNWERARALGEAIRRDALIPLPELLNKTPQAFLSEGKSRLLTYYAQVWALTRFLAERDEYRDALAQVLTDAARGSLVQKVARAPAVIARGVGNRAITSRAGPWLILAYFTDDIDQFERDYLVFAERAAR
jgi:hypothetical protein